MNEEKDSLLTKLFSIPQVLLWVYCGIQIVLAVDHSSLHNLGRALIAFVIAGVLHIIHCVVEPSYFAARRAKRQGLKARQFPQPTTATIEQPPVCGTDMMVYNLKCRITGLLWKHDGSAITAIELQTVNHATMSYHYFRVQWPSLVPSGKENAQRIIKLCEHNKVPVPEFQTDSKE